jgi:peptide/nickel transport system permease protein
MVRFAINRIAQAIPLMVLVVLLVFTMLQFTPGDPVQAMVGQYPVPHEFRAAIEKRYHLNDPLPSRLIQYFGNLLHGDVGYSFQLQRPVLDLILERAPRTLLLAGAGFLIGVPLGIAIGVVSATTPRRSVDRLWTTATLIAYAIPGFWLGQLLVIGVVLFISFAVIGTRYGLAGLIIISALADGHDRQARVPQHVPPDAVVREISGPMPS